MVLLFFRTDNWDEKKGVVVVDRIDDKLLFEIYNDDGDDLHTDGDDDPG